MRIESYTKKQLVLRGAPRRVGAKLRKLGGRFKSLVKGAPGWLFPVSRKADLQKYIHKSGKKPKKLKTPKPELKPEPIVEDISGILRPRADSTCENCVKCEKLLYEALALLAYIRSKRG